MHPDLPRLIGRNHGSFVTTPILGRRSARTGTKREAAKKYQICSQGFHFVYDWDLSGLTPIMMNQLLRVAATLKPGFDVVEP